jgi:hypothetical protein
MWLVMRGTLSLLAAGALLFGGASCGTAQGPGSEVSAVVDTSTIARYGGPWGVDITEAPRQTGEPTLVEQLGVFRQKRLQKDAFDPMVPDSRSDSVEGKEIYGQSRLFTTSNGPDDIVVFGVPTENGWVCPHFVYTDGEETESGPCWSTLRRGVGFSLEGDGSFYRLYGVAADDVLGVDVVAAGNRFHADMGRNSFVFGAKTVAVCPTDIDRLVIEHKGGTTSEIELASVSSIHKLSGTIFGCR